jgi:hypothetical protein
LNFQEGKKKSKSKVIEAILDEAFGSTRSKNVVDQILLKDFVKKPPMFCHLVFSVLKLSLPCGQYWERLKEAGIVKTHTRKLSGIKDHNSGCDSSSNFKGRGPATSNK